MDNAQQNNERVALYAQQDREKIGSTPKPSIPLEVVTFVYGVNVDEMSAESLIENIKRVEGEIADLDKVKSRSRAIALRKNKLRDQLDKMLALLDIKDGVKEEKQGRIEKDLATKTPSEGYEPNY